MRVGTRYTGRAPETTRPCRTDLWQLRSTRAISSRVTLKCPTRRLHVESPCSTKYVWSEPKTRAALRSASPIGPVCSNSEPSSSTEIDRSLRSTRSPK